jgi:hypothetical protein
MLGWACLMTPWSRGLSLSVFYQGNKKVVLEFCSALSITRPMVGWGSTNNWKIRIIQSMYYMKRVKPTRCYTMFYWTLWIAQHVSGITMPIIRSLRLYRRPQRVAPHLGYGRLLVWCVAVGLSVRVEGSCTTIVGEVPHTGGICIVASSWWWA